MTPTDQEALMLGMLREWSETDNCRMLIEHRDGAWELSMTVVGKDRQYTARGVGATFAQAWNNMNPTDV